jgi:hypothetical protein
MLWAKLQQTEMAKMSNEFSIFMILANALDQT